MHTRVGNKINTMLSKEDRVLSKIFTVEAVCGAYCMAEFLTKVILLLLWTARLKRLGVQTSKPATLTSHLAPIEEREIVKSRWILWNDCVCKASPSSVQVWCYYYKIFKVLTFLDT